MELYTPLADNGRHRSRPHRAAVVRRGTLLVFAVVAAVLLSLVFAAPVSAATGDFIIQGRGYGHGVGMSQWGAWQGARDGQTYNNILAFYYPGSAPAAAPAGATIKVRISANPAVFSTDDDHYYRVYLKPAVTTATLVMHTAGSPPVLEALSVGQVVEALYNISGDHHVWLVGRGAYDSIEVIPTAGTGRVSVSMQVSSVSAPTTYREYWGYMSVDPMSGGELYLHNYVLLDEYVRGVAEIIPQWADISKPTLYAVDAVKAQAVAARTYAWADFSANGYVNDDTSDLCFKGYSQWGC